MEPTNSKETVRIELTEQQKEQLRRSTGQDANAIEFSVQELEDRIAPVVALDLDAM
jgi:hypothetical protein